MRFAPVAVAMLALFCSGAALAQGWFMFEDKAEFFTVNFPHEPKVEDIMLESEYGMELTGRVYTAENRGSTYKITVLNYEGAQVTDVRGSVAWMATKFRQGPGKITYDAYAQIDRIEGHQLQILNADESRTFIGMHLHARRLYILEATVPRGTPPPAQFQVSLGIFGTDGNRVRYDIDADGQRTPATEGGALGEAP